MCEGKLGPWACFARKAQYFLSALSKHHSPHPDPEPEVLSPLPVDDAPAPAEAAVAELQDKLLRALADAENTRKRLQREKQEAVQYAATSVLEKILPLLDHFEMGLAAAQTATDPRAIVDGFGMVYTQFQQLLQELNVEPIDAVGQPFDPHRHEALGEQETTEYPEGTVVSQTRRGYRLRDRLLRPAAVYVAKPPAGE